MLDFEANNYRGFRDALYALRVSHDAETLVQWEREVRYVLGSGYTSEDLTCANLPNDNRSLPMLGSEVRAIAASYPDVFPVTVSLESAAVALSAFARERRAVFLDALDRVNQKSDQPDETPHETPPETPPPVDDGYGGGYVPEPLTWDANQPDFSSIPLMKGGHIVAHVTNADDVFQCMEEGEPGYASPEQIDAEARATARRLVACYNACAGISTSLLETHAAVGQHWAEARADSVPMAPSLAEVALSENGLLFLYGAANDIVFDKSLSELRKRVKRERLVPRSGIPSEYFQLTASETLPNGKRLVGVTSIFSDGSLTGLAVSEELQTLMLLVLGIPDDYPDSDPTPGGKWETLAPLLQATVKEAKAK